MSEACILRKILYKKAGLWYFAAFVPAVQTTSAPLCKQILLPCPHPLIHQPYKLF